MKIQIICKYLAITSKEFKRRVATIIVLIISCLMLASSAIAAIALDRTRVIVDGDAKSISLSISNENRELPYLAQAWIEDERGGKITSPLTALPPVQRVEPGAKGQIKIQLLPETSNLLAQDRESLFYFNMREIPPRSKKPNTLQIALQTRVKLFYRPSKLKVDNNTKPWQENLTLVREGDKYLVNNPTPYYITLVGASAGKNGSNIDGFKNITVPPRSSERLGGTAKALGNAPVLTYVNDYGGRPSLSLICDGVNCHVVAASRG